jgi:hypothetical protein
MRSHCSKKGSLLSAAVNIHLLLICLLLSFNYNPCAGVGNLDNPDDQNIQLSEQDRIVEYTKRNYTWPPTKFTPDTIGWKELMIERFNQVSELQNSGERYNGYMQTVNSAFVVPNFTQYGFGLARCPDDLLHALQKGIRDGLPTAGVETSTEVIDAPEKPLFIDRPDLTARVLSELRNYAEEWSGVELTAYRAYGFRLYRNHSQLTMHVDKTQTHIISFILHIDSSDDAEPWPIFIEDFHGRTHEVILKPGDMLFYESSKCFHGRPRRLNGSWYSSLFVHYYPKHGWYDLNHELEAHYAVPPIWSVDPPANVPNQYTKLQMAGTSLKHPDCPDEWCYTQHSVKWSGPGKDGYWIDPFGNNHPFNPIQYKAGSDEL